MYVLMLVDRLSRFVMFFPTKTANAVDAARAIMVWASIFGLPSWLISDGGSHFKNELIKEFTELVGINQPPHHLACRAALGLTARLKWWGRTCCGPFAAPAVRCGWRRMSGTWSSH